jgi:hypothetical protein
VGSRFSARAGRRVFGEPVQDGSGRPDALKQLDDVAKGLLFVESGVTGAVPTVPDAVVFGSRDDDLCRSPRNRNVIDFGFNH